MDDNQNTEAFVVMRNDILFGRGKSKDNHPGNKAYRDTVSKYKLSYLLEAKTTKEKRTLVDLIISEVKDQDPPGRFLCNDDGDDSWYEEDDVGKIRKKVAQALREDASSTRRLLRRRSSIVMSTTESTDPPRHKRSSKEGKTKKKNIQDNDDDHILTQNEDNNQEVLDFVASPDVARRNSLYPHYSQVKTRHCVSMSSIEDNTDELTNRQEPCDLDNTVYPSPVPSILVHVSPSDESSVVVNKARRQKWSKFAKLTLPHMMASSSSTTVLSNSSLDDDDDSASEKPTVNKKRKSKQLKSTITREDKALKKVVPQDSSPSNLSPCLVEKEVQSEQDLVFLQEHEKGFRAFESGCWWEQEETTSHGFDWWSIVSRTEGGK